MHFNEKPRVQNKTRSNLVNSNNPVFYPFSVKVNKYGGNCNNISNPYAR